MSTTKTTEKYENKRNEKKVERKRKKNRRKKEKKKNKNKNADYIYCREKVMSRRNRPKVDIRQMLADVHFVNGLKKQSTERERGGKEEAD